MRHVQALLVKYLMVGSILAIVLPVLGPATFGQGFAVALVVTAGSYIVGDLIVFPEFGNILAAVFDSALVLALIWVSQLLVPGFITTFGAMAVAAALVGIAEWFFHRYLRVKGVAPLPGEEKV
ncbi:MAG: DUF2512 family protein [Bacillota bacterium]